MKKISRRKLLGYSATTLGVAALGVGTLGVGTLGCSRPDPMGLVPQLLTLAQDRDSLAAIGVRYLEQAPEQKIEVIAQRLASDLDWSPGLAGQELAHRLAELVSRDYRDGKTKSVGHWILSDTEVHWTALVALSSSTSPAAE